MSFGQRLSLCVRSLILPVTLLLPTFSVPGQGIELPSPITGLRTEESLVTLELSFEQPSADRVAGRVDATIKEGWHINSSTPLDSYAIPTVLKIDSTALKVGEIRYPAHKLQSFGFSDGKELAVYEGKLTIPFAATILSAVGTVKATLSYQACNDRICLPPKQVVIDSPFPGTVIAAPATQSTVPAAADGSFVPLDQAGRSRGVFSSDIQGTFASRGLPLTLLAVFVLGLALNLTPCVYPLIPITIAFFSSQSEGRRRQRILLSSCYVLGIALTYSALGVFSAFSGRLFGSWLQQPAVLVFFALLMLTMAASMFGLFEIRVPHFISDRAGARGGYAGSLTMGLLIGIVAAPCVGPFVISLIALISQTGNPYLGFLLFFVLALGLGVPYLLLGIFSSGAATIPRSGLWMVQVKKAMGFVLIAMAIYFLRPLIDEEYFRWSIGGSLVAGGLFLLATGGRSLKGGGNVIRVVCAVLLLGAGTWFVLQRSRDGMTWVPHSDNAVIKAKEESKPIIIDFYADWCLPCKELDAKTFNDSDVMSEGAKFVRLKADLSSSEDRGVRELTERYQIVGVPTIVFIDSRGFEIREQRLTGFEAPEKFLRRMRAAR
ncbi:MAG TPA: cytochrome c biogenesis protein CcdA [Thermoanaerobaculia bacterium]|nr:cytochrome c biogenesis protein CcdA [Thermoanaerobaculia bacterium]